MSTSPDSRNSSTHNHQNVRKSFPGLPVILAVAALSPTVITSVWLPLEGASTWIWVAVSIAPLAALAIILFMVLLIREHRALHKTLEQQEFLEEKLISITRALGEAETQIENLINSEIQAISSPGVKPGDMITPEAERPA